MDVRLNESKEKEMFAIFMNCDGNLELSGKVVLEDWKYYVAILDLSFLTDTVEYNSN